MPRINLTETNIERKRELRAPHFSGRQTIYWDTNVRGFGVRVSGVTNQRAYVAQRDFRGGRKGPRITIAKVGELSLDEARGKAHDVFQDVRNNVDPRLRRRGGTPQAAMTLRQMLDLYLERQDLTENSQRGYRSVTDNHLADWMDRPLGEITAAEVEQRYHDLARARSAALANLTMRTLRALFRYAKRRDRTLPPSPTEILTGQWKKVEPRTTHVGAGRMNKFYAAVLALENEVACDWLSVLLFTGLRKKAAASLTWRQVDLVEGTITVRSKRGRKQFTLPLGDYPLKLLKARWDKYGDTDYVFPAASKSGHIESTYPFDLIAEATGITVTPHSLRKDFFTACANTEISVVALKMLVDHTVGSSVTSDYIQMTTAQLRGPAQKVCDKLKQWCGVAE
jgi:integrase